MIHVSRIMAFVALLTLGSPALGAFGRVSPERLKFYLEAANIANACALSIEKNIGLRQNYCDSEIWDCPKSIAAKEVIADECLSSEIKPEEKLFLMGILLGSLQSQARCLPKYMEFYFIQEGSATCTYNGKHFEILKKTYLRSRFVELIDALLAEGNYKYYECEGENICVVENVVDGPLNYLDQYPDGKFRKQMLDEVLNGLGLVEKQTQRDWFEKVMQRIEALAAKLPKGPQQRLLNAIEAARVKAGT